MVRCPNQTSWCGCICWLQYLQKGLTSADLPGTKVSWTWKKIYWSEDPPPNQLLANQRTNSTCISLLVIAADHDLLLLGQYPKGCKWHHLPSNSDEFHSYAYWSWCMSGLTFCHERQYLIAFSTEIHLWEPVQPRSVQCFRQPRPQANLGVTGKEDMFQCSKLILAGCEYHLPCLMPHLCLMPGQFSRSGTASSAKISQRSRCSPSKWQTSTGAVNSPLIWISVIPYTMSSCSSCSHSAN